MLGDAVLYSRKPEYHAMGDAKRTAGAGPTPDAILAYLRKIAREQLGLKPEQVERIDLETDVVEGLDLDSLGQVILLSELEEHFDLAFTLEDRERLQTIQKVKDLVGLIRRAAGGADPP